MIRTFLYQWSMPQFAMLLFDNVRVLSANVSGQSREGSEKSSKGMMEYIDAFSIKLQQCMIFSFVFFLYPVSRTEQNVIHKIILGNL